MTVTTKKALTFQELLFTLQKFWSEHGCVLQQPYDLEVGAGTMSPDTFLRVLGPKPISIAYAQPSRRPADGRYGENPNRLFRHTQLQVILKPPPENVQELYLQSLVAIGIDLRQHDIKFEEDNWEWPVGGAWGVGWQVMLDGQEITQYTYLQQCSAYAFDYADTAKLWEHLNLYEAECKSLLAQWPGIATGERVFQETFNEIGVDRDSSTANPIVLRFPTMGAYELALKCSHTFNLLDARGAISVTERVGVMGRIRTLIIGVAKVYAEQGRLTARVSESAGEQASVVGA